MRFLGHALWALSLGILAEAVYLQSGISSIATFTSQDGPMQKAMSGPTPKDMYFDLTNIINCVMEGGDPEIIRNISRWRKEKGYSKPNVFYSTDRLFSEMPELSEVTNLLESNEVTSFNLYLSFQLMHNGSISEDYFADIFALIPSDEDSIEQVKSLKNHVSGILLDFQSNQSYCEDFQYGRQEERYQSYDRKHHISFPKYAKRFGSALLGRKDLKVGVIYSYNQIMCRNILQKGKDADLQIISFDLYPGYEFPMSYKSLAEGLLHTKSQYRMNSGKNMTNLMFKLNIVRSHPEKYLRHKFNSEDLETVVEIVKRSEKAYFPVLKSFGKRWAEEGRSEIILSSEIKPVKGCGKKGQDDNLVPYLHVQDVEVNACQFKTMLGQTAANFGFVAVSEYTWMAFARSNDTMSPEKCPNSLELPENAPTTFLIFTSGIGSMWNATEEYFNDLLTEHQTISGWNLKTLVFSAEDVVRSAMQNNNNIPLHYLLTDVSEDQGILRFANEMKNDYDYEIGCLVDFGDMYFTRDGFHRVSTYYTNHTTWNMCRHMWDVSNVVVWSFDIPFESKLVEMLGHNNFELKNKLLGLLVARERLMEEWVEKDIIFKINLVETQQTFDYERKRGQHPNHYYSNDTVCPDIVAEIKDFYNGIQTWATIHGVKVILPPAYDLQEPLKGLWDIPKENGTPSKFNTEECIKKAIARYE